MSKDYFKQIESKPLSQMPSSNELIAQLSFNQDGLIPCIAQQHDTKTVLMLAWMNRESILKTIETKQMWYWSRSRQAYWRKGESSGHIQDLIEMRTDCDGDALLCLVNQSGPACHTLKDNCFFHTLS